MSIIVEDITKLYGTQKALNHVSFEIKTGDVVGFLGPNGAGKSTMMKILTGFIPASSGKATVNGFDIQQQSLEVRRTIGYLPEHNPLYLEMYVKEYLEFVGGLYRLGKQTQSRISEMIERTGLQLEQKKRIGELSKGYRQRVGLAQALIHNPKVLILDEPTTGLDPNQIVEIRNLISELGKEKTIMLSTHIMQEVEAICDKVIIINRGSIVADDSAKDIQLHSAEKTQSIIVEFNKLIPEKELLKIKNVSAAIALKNSQYLIQSTSEQDIRPAIFQYAVSQNLIILQLLKKEKRLEEVFQELTKG